MFPSHVPEENVPLHPVGTLGHIESHQTFFLQELILIFLSSRDSGNGTSPFSSCVRCLPTGLVGISTSYRLSVCLGEDDPLRSAHTLHVLITGCPLQTGTGSKLHILEAGKAGTRSVLL